MIFLLRAGQGPGGAGIVQTVVYHIATIFQPQKDQAVEILVYHRFESVGLGKTICIYL